MIEPLENRPLRGTYRHLAVWSSFVLSIAANASVEATPRFESPTLYLKGDTLTVDLRVDSLFSARVRDAIASGMTTSIDYEFLLEPVGPARAIRRAVTVRLDHDIWEGRYQVVRHASRPDTLVTKKLEEAILFCSDLEGLQLAPLTDDSVSFVLRVRTVVNPISPEQEVRTRKWLNLLDRGSILELFFSLDPKEDDTDWVEIARFRKQDLPTEVPSSGVAHDTEAEVP